LYSRNNGIVKDGMKSQIKNSESFLFTQNAHLSKNNMEEVLNQNKKCAENNLSEPFILRHPEDQSNYTIRETESSYGTNQNPLYNNEVSFNHDHQILKVCGSKCIKEHYMDKDELPKGR
jgi:hypothetical protein